MALWIAALASLVSTGAVQPQKQGLLSVAHKSLHAIDARSDGQHAGPNDGPDARRRPEQLYPVQDRLHELRRGRARCSMQMVNLLFVVYGAVALYAVRGAITDEMRASSKVPYALMALLDCLGGSVRGLARRGRRASSRRSSAKAWCRAPWSRRRYS